MKTGLAVEEKPHEATVSMTWGQVLGAFLLALLPIAALWWFVSSVSTLGHAMRELPPVVECSNGFGYTLGAVVALGPLSVVSMYGTLAPRMAPARYQRFAFQCLIAGLVLMLVGNPLATFLLDHYFLTAGYQVCEPLSSRWMNHRSVVYTLPGSGECERLAVRTQAPRK
ncbi:hypothetical protein M8A51_13500 [Schlegelella sp. S2-27]|uniref:DUF998 domain-containing protein n=1 Tax=Caldimonas mangrovi TaxID=2944811 RepID=A0ABT0YP80_9BURK|nr:hypothetical protein [Caldimonas mangrovi]MCM5680542.1 hypothetical protein [Caldimonas mangrovi]